MMTTTLSSCTSAIYHHSFIQISDLSSPDHYRERASKPAFPSCSFNGRDGRDGTRQSKQNENPLRINCRQFVKIDKNDKQTNGMDRDKPHAWPFVRCAKSLGVYIPDFAVSLHRQMKL